MAVCGLSVQRIILLVTCNQNTISFSANGIIFQSVLSARGSWYIMLNFMIIKQFNGITHINTFLK